MFYQKCVYKYNLFLYSYISLILIISLYYCVSLSLVYQLILVLDEFPALFVAPYSKLLFVLFVAILMLVSI